MTWIRLDTDFADHDIIGRMAEALRIDPDRAAMSLIRVWCRFADHQPNGNALAITDTTLEDWAKWRGRRGVFAAAFRAHGVDDGGAVRGWWRQESLLRHQAEKRKHRRKTGTEPAPVSGPDLAYNNNKNSNSNQLLVVGGTAEVAYLVRCVTALNRGLKANRRLEGFREVSSSEQQGRVTWEADGIPVELAAQVVEQVAEAYQPGPRSRQPNSLRYFDAAVRRAHEQAVQAATNPSQEPQEAAWLSR